MQVKRSDGHLVAKAVDFDISMFKNSLLSDMELKIKFAGGTCKRDNDCNYNPINCLGECDLATGTCTGRLKSSNLVVSNPRNIFLVCMRDSICSFLLQTMCRDLFTKMHPLHPYLLYNPPASIAEPLGTVVEECSKPGPSQIDWDLFRELKSILLSSIHDDS